MTQDQDREWEEPTAMETLRFKQKCEALHGAAREVYAIEWFYKKFLNHEPSRAARWVERNFNGIGPELYAAIRSLITRSYESGEMLAKIRVFTQSEQKKEIERALLPHDQRIRKEVAEGIEKLRPQKISHPWEYEWMDALTAALKVVRGKPGSTETP